jgi:hypothetical protein
MRFVASLALLMVLAACSSQPRFQTIAASPANALDTKTGQACRTLPKPASSSADSSKDSNDPFAALYPVSLPYCVDLK